MPIATRDEVVRRDGSAPLSRQLTVLLAAGAGLCSASIYFVQPILGTLSVTFPVGDWYLSLIPTATQIGFSAGIFFLNPLSDRFDRRAAILIKAAALVAALALTGLARSYSFLLGASVLLGLSATLAQDLIPAAATLAPPQNRGKVVGTVMTGLLLGILLSRLVSGTAAQLFGWRAVYGLGAAAMAVVTVAAWRMMPRFETHSQLTYPALLLSMASLWRRHAALRRAAMVQGLLALAFSAYWSSLALMLYHRYHLGSSVAGAFGLAGAAGILAAPLAGRLADRKRPELVARGGCAIAAFFFALMGLLFLLPVKAQIALLVVSAIGFDFGVQGTMICHQTIIYGVDPSARSRLNAVYITGMFLGMSAGSSLGGWALEEWGWAGVTVLATAASLAALALRCLPGASGKLCTDDDETN